MENKMEKARKYIRSMRVDDSMQYRVESYRMLVELYCEGEDIVINETTQTVTKVDKAFTEARIKYASMFPEHYRLIAESKNKTQHGIKGK